MHANDRTRLKIEAIDLVFEQEFQLRPPGRRTPRSGQLTMGRNSIFFEIKNSKIIGNEFSQ
jgi:hypothetical protein